MTTTATNGIARTTPAPLVDEFRDGVMADAVGILSDILGTERGQVAGSRVAMALVALAKTQPKIRQIGMTGAGRQSIANVIAMCALTGLMPGGALPGVYVIPRDRRQRTADGSGWETISEINFQIGARGLMDLARRAGVQLCAFASYEGAEVSLDANDRLIIPTQRRKVERTWDRLIGVVVTAHDLKTGASLGRFFVEADHIEARRNASDAWQRGQETTHTMGQKKGQKKADWEMERDRSSPWYVWPEEMALKTALAYVIRRGYVPVDDVAEHVLGVDAKADAPVVIEADAVTVGQRPTGRRALGLPDYGGAADPFDAEEFAQRDRVAGIPRESTDPGARTIDPLAPLRALRWSDKDIEMMSDPSRTWAVEHKATPDSHRVEENGALRMRE